MTKTIEEKVEKEDILSGLCTAIVSMPEVILNSVEDREYVIGRDPKDKRDVFTDGSTGDVFKYNARGEKEYINFIEDTYVVPEIKE